MVRSLTKTRFTRFGPYCVLLLLGAFAARPASAQRALVLSGGAARGLAHIGALEHLQELGYDPDLVVGTSMGAVIGALYAAGYDAGEIRARVLALRWDEMFDPTPIVLGPDRALRLPALALDLNIGRLRARRGLFGQWRVNRALAGLLFDANARSRGDFDRLPRRFRPVAADLQTGQAVVLDTGDVARAVRASMAFPGFFSSVPWGERVLVDGGIADNFPTSAARDLGASYIVGVDVTRPPPGIRSQAPFAVVDRVLNLMLQNLQNGRPRPDALVLPIIAENFAGPTFPGDPEPVIRAGYDAARRDLAAIELPVGRRVLYRPAPPPSFSEVRVEAPDPALAAFARKAFRAVIGRPYSAELIAARTDRLFATGLFEGVWPRVIASADSAEPAVLLVRLEAPPRVSLSIGAQYETDRGGRAWASLDANHRIGQLPAVYTLSAAAGSLERWGSASMRVYGVSRTAFTFGMGAHALERGVRFFEEDATRVEETLRLGGWAGVELPHLLRQQLLFAGVRAERIEVEAGEGVNAIGPALRIAAVASEARVAGLPLLIEAEQRWGDLAYARGVFSGSLVFGGKRGPQLGVVADVRAVSSRAPEDVHPALGDEHAIPGLRWGAYRDRARAVAGIDVAIPVGAAYARLRGRSGAVAPKPADLGTRRWVTGGQLGVFLRTPIGVIEAGYGFATRGDGRFDISLGRGF